MINFLSSVQNISVVPAPTTPFELFNGTKLIADCDVLRSLVSPTLKQAMGELEFSRLMRNRAAFWGQYDYASTNNAAAQDRFDNWIMRVQLFLTGLWVVEDNCIHCDNGFFEDDSLAAYSSLSGLIPVSRSDGLDNVVKECRPDELKFAKDFLAVFLWLTDRGSPDALGFQTAGSHLVNKTRSRIWRSLNFLILARSAKDVALRMSSYVSSLEALFSTDDSEIAHKLSERVAYYIGRDSAERMRIYKFLKRAYTVRSKLVHGDDLSLKYQQELGALVTETDGLLRTIIRRILEEGVEDSVFEGKKDELDEYFTRLVLGKDGWAQ